MPLGVDEKSSWQQKSMQFKNGDVLVLYTDGIPDAQNVEGEFFGEQRLVETLRSYMGMSAQEMLLSIVHEVYHFAAEAVQYDDITLVILAKTT